MNGQDQKMTATSTGHEGHGVHLCHRCRWPFPNPHPSAKHRKAHKKVCGTIEGYKIIHSEENDHHLAVSDEEHASDEDEHTPNPKLVMKTAEELGSSGGVDEKSSRSEDDVFSDAVTEFSDSGISQQLAERFESVRGLDKSMEQKCSEADMYGSESLNVDATAVDTTDQVDPIRREEISNPGTLVNTNNQSETVVPLTYTSAERASGGLIMGLQPDVESDILRDLDVNNIIEYDNWGSVKGHMKDKSAYIILESEEGIITAYESKEELCDKLVSEVVKHETETLQNLGASAEVESVAHSAEISGESMQTSLFATDHSDEPVVSSIDIEVKQKTSLAGGEIAGNFDASDENRCDMGGNENQNLEESKNNFSLAFACGDDDQSTRAFEKDVNRGEGKSSCKFSGTRNEKGEGASAKVQVMPLIDSINIPSSCEAATEAEDVHKSSKLESSSPEFRDNTGFDKAFEGFGTGNVTKPQQSVVSVDLNHDRKYSPISTLEDPASPIITEPTNNIYVTSNVVGAESVDVAGIMNSANGDNTYTISEGAAGASKKCSPVIVSGTELTSAGDVVTSEKCSVTPSLKEPVPSLDVWKNSHENCATNNVINADDDVATGVNSKSLQHEVDEKLSSHKVGVAATNNNSNSKSDCLGGKCGSVPGKTLMSG